MHFKRHIIFNNYLSNFKLIESRFLLLFILTSVSLKVNAQTEKVKLLSKISPVFVDSIKREPSDTLLFIPFNFNEYLLDADDESLLQKIPYIWEVDLVYSTFVLSKDFDQVGLNYKRFTELQKALPDLFHRDMIQWKIIGETGHTDMESAKKNFSGFVFHLLPKQSEETAMIESKLFTDMLKLGDKPRLEIKKEIIGEVKLKTEEKVKSYEGVKVEAAKASYTKGYPFNTTCLSLITSKKPGLAVVTAKVLLLQPLKKKPKMKGGENGFYMYITNLFTNKPTYFDRKTKSITSIYTFKVNSKGEMIDIGVESTTQPSKMDTTVLEALHKMPVWKKGDLGNCVLKYKFYTTMYKSKHQVLFTSKLQFCDVGKLSICEVIDSTKSKLASDTLLRDVGFVDIFLAPSFYEDSLVTKIFNRNKSWKKTLVVADLTGSMYPYAAQLLLWFKMQYTDGKSSIHCISFFNDGDAKGDYEKKVGSVGGIYNLKTEGVTFDAIANLATKTIMNGGGGDSPENNVEAIINASSFCPECEDIIMIADNYATPRDLKLVKQVTKPVKLILCGTQNGINTLYLDFLRANKGSLHTMEKDITDLSTMKEGDTIEINKRTYQLKQGSFVKMIKLW